MTFQCIYAYTFFAAQFIPDDDPNNPIPGTIRHVNGQAEFTPDNPADKMRINGPTTGTLRTDPTPPETNPTEERGKMSPGVDPNLPFIFEVVKETIRKGKKLSSYVHTLLTAVYTV